MKTSATPIVERAVARIEKRTHDVWFVACVILVVAAIGRFLHLGAPGFSSGELFHVFAAKSHLKDGSFYVPMWGEYDIARPVTLLTSFMFRTLGESEFSARLPFAAASVGFLAFAFILLRRLFSSGVALVSLFVLGMAPLSVESAREVRMFSLHAMFYFAAAVSFLVGLEDLWRRPRGASLRSYRMDPRWLGASVIFGAAAWVLHPLTVTLAITIPVYLAAMTAAVWLRVGARHAIISKYAICLVLFGAAVGVVSHVRPGLITALWNEAGLVYGWQAALNRDGSFYRYVLTDGYPALLFIYPVGIYAALRQHGRRGVFFVAAFLPAAIALTFVARKSDRYILHLFPFFVATAAAAIAPLASWARNAFRVHFGARPVRQKLLSLLLFAPAVLVFAHPWLESSLRIPFRARNPDWKSIDPTFKRAVEDGTVVTANPREVLYYFGKAPRYFRTVEREAADIMESGFVTSSGEFHRAVTRGRDIYFIGAEWNFFNDAFLDADMRNSVLFNMAPVDHGGDRRILAFHRE